MRNLNNYSRETNLVNKNKGYTNNSYNNSYNKIKQNASNVDNQSKQRQEKIMKLLKTQLNSNQNFIENHKYFEILFHKLYYPYFYSEWNKKEFEVDVDIVFMKLFHEYYEKYMNDKNEYHKDFLMFVNMRYQWTKFLLYRKNKEFEL